MLSKKAPAFIAVAVLSVWMIREAQHLGGGGKPPPAEAPPPQAQAEPAAPAVAAPAPQAAPEVRFVEATINKGTSLSTTLHKLGIAGKDIAKLAAGIKPVYDVARIAAGSYVKAIWENFVTLPPARVEVKLDEKRTFIAARGETGDWSAEVQEAVVDTQLASYAGVVATTLWNSASVAGMDPNLIQKLAEVFAWQVDFNREVQEGDRWRLSVKRHYVAGKPIGFGDIVAAEYENAGQVYTAVLFTTDDGFPQYYMPDGSSLRRMFLKSPLKFGRITSGFTSRRFHPVLKVMKAHLGVDYGAPTGTPVMSVGDGVVSTRGWRGGSGNMIEIKHNSTYLTAYKHLSRYADDVKPGARVAMGQVIGYVGATGLATGPHLHFEFHESGRVVDPQGLKFPSADPVPEAQRERFLADAARATSELPPWSSAVLSQRRTESEAEDGIPNE